ncbi:SET and MYND domain-containing protein 4 isoform X2 [Toxorhynchites rutilus septentrionalis]|uniref:SET and MYND domain-containing protein 4 isoform X2 n=1 Tax=Toxorhynchites rutilus septentrionalis TaxID=329112 RepID=UPI002478BA8E|nr:SET and MYND domain-containing protein 4 isoform X2 [Toxorhynchites rutilus septentrionalis]
MASIDNDPLFTSLCSAKTLQSQREGFFNAFYQTVAENFTGKNEHWLRDVFAKVPPGDDCAKLQLLYDDPTVCFEVLGTLEHVKPVFRGKDAKFSWQRREQALKLLHEGKAQQALLMASQAVMRAPAPDVDTFVDKGKTLACALWTRAEVLIRTLDGKHAMVDLQMAAKAGFPVKENGEYYARMARCYALMGESKRAEISVKLFHQLSGCNDYALGRLREDLEDLRILKAEDALIKPPQAERKFPELAGGENKEFIGTSVKLTMCGTQQDSSKGRYLVAAEDLHPGEAVVVEPASAACLYTKYCGTYCNLCFTKLTAPIACPDCSGVAFCSPECRDRACSGYHRFECQYLDLMIGSGMSILCHLALRLITQAGSPEKAIEVGTEFRQSLCSHSEFRDPEDYFQRALMAAFLLRCLQKAEFFGRRKTEAAEPTPIEAKVGGVILELLQSLQFNAHEIYETKISGEHRIDSAKVSYIGVGIYKAAAMLNHECHPGVSRTFLGTSILLHTSRPISKGSVIPENYGMHFLRHPLPVRQKNLRSRYWFKCDCKACTEDWQLMDKLPDRPRLRCPHPGCDGAINYPAKEAKAKCWRCKRNVSLETSIRMLRECEEIYTEGAKLMEDERADEAINLLSKGIELFYQIAVPPHKPTHVAEESLRVCFADQGNAYRV